MASTRAMTTATVVAQLIPQQLNVGRSRWIRLICSIGSSSGIGSCVTIVTLRLHCGAWVVRPERQRSCRC